MRPAVAGHGRAYARNVEFENREEWKAAVHSGLSGGGSKESHDKGIYTLDLQCQHKLTK